MQKWNSFVQFFISCETELTIYQVKLHHKQQDNNKSKIYLISK